MEDARSNNPQVVNISLFHVNYTEKYEIHKILSAQTNTIGHAVSRLVEVLRYKPEGSRVRLPMVSLEFFVDIIVPAALWP